MACRGRYNGPHLIIQKSTWLWRRCVPTISISVSVSQFPSCKVAMTVLIPCGVFCRFGTRSLSLKLRDSTRQDPKHYNDDDILQSHGPGYGIDTVHVLTGMTILS